MGKIRFIKGKGSLARPLAGEDHISGLVIYSDNLPSGYSAQERVKLVVDITAAEALGIVNDKSDEVKATGGKVKITTAGASATVAAIIMDTVTLGSYTLVLADTADDVAEGLAAAINLGTATHGYTATQATDTVNLVAPAGLGDSINDGTHLSFTSTGTGAATVTQFSGGVDPYLDVVHYHIDEFFRINPGAQLYVGFFDVPESAYDFNELITIQNGVGGKIRQFGIYMGSVSFATAHMNSLQARADALDTVIKPVSILYAANIVGATLASIRTLSDPKVHAIIGQDGDHTGAALFAEKGYSITCLGAALGATSRAKVHENIGWVGKFDMSGDNELMVPAMADGVLLTTMTDAAIDLIDSYGYIFLQKYVGETVEAAGTYFNDNHSAVSLESDYAFMNDNRTMDKAIRRVYGKMLPQLNGPITIDPTSGKLAPYTVAYLESLGNAALEQMERDGELSGYKAVINPDQNLLQTSNLQVVIKNVPIGVSRNINIKISFTNKI